MTELSPIAQAVLDAVEDDCIHPDDKHRIAAATLRAVVDQLGESRAPGAEFEDLYPRIIEVDELLALAAELESLPE